MAIPGLSLPGLTLASNTIDEPTAPVVETKKIETLSARTEYRFETSFSLSVTIKVIEGNAELFGTELAPNTAYNFKGTKGAIYTWEGCTLEITGNLEGDYVAEETKMDMYANVHFALEQLREEARRHGNLGPRVLVVGPENSGKTSLVKILTSYAVKSARQPMVVNLDPRQGMLSLPGSLAAAAFASLLDIEEGWGFSPISGPSPAPVKMPLCYHFGTEHPEDNTKIFRSLVTRMALAVTSRLSEDSDVKEAGIIIDTPGSLSSGKGGGYDLIQHIVSEFSVDILLVMGSERLHTEMRKRLGGANPEGPVTIVKLDKSEGCVEREASYMRQLRQQQIREYFFGRGNVTLQPYTQQADFKQLSIFRIIDPSGTNSSFNPGGEDDDDDEYTPQLSITSLYERILPSLMLQNCLLTVTYAHPNDNQEAIRDSSIMGYVYVADVDEAKKKIKLLSPVSGNVPTRALIYGSWPEDFADLVA
jgi:polyribonucleotide 5'-hydroxyl-kinase